MSTATTHHFSIVLIFSVLCPLLAEMIAHRDAGPHVKVMVNTALSAIFSASAAAGTDNATTDNLIVTFLMCCGFSQAFHSLHRQLGLPSALGELFPPGLGMPKDVELGNENSPHLFAGTPLLPSSTDVLPQPASHAADCRWCASGNH